MLILLAAGLYLLAAAELPRLAAGDMPLDLRTFYLAARSDGARIYDPEHLASAGREAGVAMPVYPYLYPPPFAWWSAPLGRLGPGAAAVVWTLGSVAAAVFVLALGLWRVPSGRAGPLLVVLPVLLLPFANNLAMGQVNLFLLAWLTAACAVARGRDPTAGLLLAPAATVKVTPLGLLVFFAMANRWRVLAGCAGGLALLVAPTLATAAGRGAWRAFGELLPGLGWGADIPGLFPAGAVPNFSVAGSLARVLPSGAVAPVTGVVLAVCAGALLVQHRRWRLRGDGELLLLPYLVLMVIGAPLAYRHHVVLVYPGLVPALLAVLELGGRRRVYLLALLLVLAFVAGFDFPVHYDRLGLAAPGWRALNLYALIGLYGVGLALPDLLDRGKRRAAS